MKYPRCPPPPRYRHFLLSLILPASFCLAPLAVAQQSPKADAITGRVLGDDGHPLVNAMIDAQEVEARGPNRIYRRVTTDDEGYFRLTRLPPGHYAITASAEGYLHATARASERPTQPRDIYFQPGASVNITLQKGGVITGRVTNAEDRAVVAVTVTLEYVRDGYDRTIAAAWVEKEVWTDDRGVFRVFGLRPGSYLVRAGGRGQQYRGVSPHDSDAPTYYPSAKRETASEVRVRAGEEATGIDIRYLGERGYAIRGVVTGANDFKRAPNLKLTRLPGGGQAGFSFARVEENSIKFDFEGLADGEYELSAAREASDDDDGAASPPRRVTIDGADVNGIELRLIPFSSLSGRIIIAPDSPICQIQQGRQLTDFSLILHRDDAPQSEPPQGRTNQQGEFEIRKVEAGYYRLAPRLPIYWYLRAITLPGPAPAHRPVDVLRQGLTLQPGQHRTGLIMTVAEGGAVLGGRMYSPTNGVRLPAHIRVYLVPAEPVSANDLHRYAVTDLSIDSAFMFGNLAPGRYWILARAVPDEESSKLPVRPAAWYTESRVKLWREAKAAKTEIELQPCQRILDHLLQFGPK